MQLICQLKSNIISRTSLCTADTDNEMRIFVHFIPVCSRIQSHSFCIDNIRCRHIRKLLHCFKNLIIFCHHTALIFFILNRTSHVTDQRQLTSQEMSVRLRIHQHTKCTDRILSASCKCSSKGRSYTFIYFTIQIIDPIRKFYIHIFIICHIRNLLQKEHKHIQYKYRN